MKLLLIILTFCTSILFAQDFNVSTITTLDPVIFETSGLLYLDDKVITHNDSGGGNRLYEVDTTDGGISRTVVIANASNTDWEDICKDETYIYVGDFGNNAGTRTDLKIYRISITDYLTASNDTVYCDTVAFNYADQTSFEPATYSTNYDAEAFIAQNDSLYLFSKNWGNLKTNIYAIPKLPGSYEVSIMDSLNPAALVTGACYDAAKNELLLSAYTFGIPVVYHVNNFEGNNFSDGIATRATPAFEGSVQIEGVEALGNHVFLISAENEGGGDAWLHRVTVKNFISIAPIAYSGIAVYPTLVSDFIYIKSEALLQANIYNLNGEQVMKASSGAIDVSILAKGTYLLVLKNELGNITKRVKFIKQ